MSGSVVLVTYLADTSEMFDNSDIFDMFHSLAPQRRNGVAPCRRLWLVFRCSSRRRHECRRPPAHHSNSQVGHPKGVWSRRVAALPAYLPLFCRGTLAGRPPRHHYRNFLFGSRGGGAVQRRSHCRIFTGLDGRFANANIPLRH